MKKSMLNQMPNVNFFPGWGFPALQKLVKKAVINVIILFIFIVPDFAVPHSDVLLPSLIVDFQIVPLAGDAIERKKGSYADPTFSAPKTPIQDDITPNRYQFYGFLAKIPLNSGNRLIVLFPKVFVK